MEMSESNQTDVSQDLSFQAIDKEDERKKKYIKIFLIASVILCSVLASTAGFLIIKSVKVNFYPEIPLSVFATPTPSPTLTPTPTPIPQGRVEGEILDSFDNSFKANITVRLLGDQNYEVISDSAGKFLFENTTVGGYKINGEDNDSISESKDVTVGPGQITSVRLYVFLKNPKPSRLSGIVFEDRNKNGIKEDYEQGIGALLALHKYNSSGKTEFFANITADSSGSYSSSLNAPAKYLLVPLYKTFYTPPGSKTVIARGYGASISLNIGYIPQVATGGMKIYVFNDKNENDQRESDEEFIHYQYAEITNSTTGKVWKVAISSSGDQESNIDFGRYQVRLVPQDESWSLYYKITKGFGEANLSSDSISAEIYLGAHKLY